MCCVGDPNCGHEDVAFCSAHRPLIQVARSSVHAVENFEISLRGVFPSRVTDVTESPPLSLFMIGSTILVHEVSLWEHPMKSMVESFRQAGDTSRVVKLLGIDSRQPFMPRECLGSSRCLLQLTDAQVSLQMPRSRI
jgi:hypothetical protein